jgi:hypothetical protein
MQRLTGRPVVKSSFCVFIALLCALLALAGSSQGEDGTGGGSTSPADSAAAADSAATADSLALLARGDADPGFHPQYSSSYEMNKQARNWGQTFSVNERLGPFLVQNSTNVILGRDQNRGNRRTRFATSTATATVDLGLGFSGAMSGEMSRRTALDALTRTEDNSTKGDLSLSYSRTTGPLATNVSASAGILKNDVYGQSSLGRVRQPAIEDPVDSTRVDSTLALGTSLGVSGSATYKPTRRLSSTATFNAERSELDSRIFVFWRGRGQRDTSETSPNRNGNWMASLRTEYTHATASKLTLDLRSSNRDNEYYLVQQGIEKSRSTDNGVSLNAIWKLPLSVDGRADVYVRRSDQSYRKLPDRGTVGDQQGFTIGGYRLMPFRVEASVDFGVDLRKNSYYVTRLTENDVRSRSMKLSLKREFSRRFSVSATSNLGLTSFFYHPSDSLRINNPNEYAQRLAQDRDDYRRLLDFSVLYKPGPKFDTSLSLQRNDRKTVYVKARASGNNTQSERYQILASITYRWSGRTQITQRYSIAADYSYFVFNEAGNSLTRETKVLTEIRSRLTNRTELLLGHDFRFRDSGSYKNQLYGRSLEDTQQNLQAQTKYTLHEDLSLSLKQRIETRSAHSLFTDDTQRTTRLELIEGIDFGHSFASGLSLDGSFNRTDSYLAQPGITLPRKEKFWLIAASLSKRF